MLKSNHTLLSIGTALGSAAILYACLPIAPMVIMMATISAHEMGHYSVASLADAKAYLPIFIPLGFFIVGLTRVQQLQTEFRSAVAIAGPMSGAAAALGVLLLALWMGNIVLATAAATSLAYEIWSGVGGSDGRRFRKAKKGM